MKLNVRSTGLAALLLLDASVAAARAPANRVLLSNVKTLTLRKDATTAHRRVPPIPQLTCIGGSARGLYEPDVIRCTNAGSDYSPDNVQWTCKASLPPEFKLGATDVICEGYDGPDDPYILKGSCGLEYRLVLTEAGEEKYGHRRDDGSESEMTSPWAGYIFWALFVGVLCWMIYRAVWGERAPGGGGLPGGGAGGWGGGWGGGDDPPPPYDPRPPQPPCKPSPGTGAEAWRPGFWSGAMGGAAAGYLAGQRRQGQDTRAGPAHGQAGGSNWFGGARRGNTGDAGRRESSSPSPSTARWESTGFGGTRRR
ncbi:hypothetical protein EJ06DRAFT_535767 [Trichodelitschia bisporula]|uniref:Store-operated calcium entry-associated regulatory factor n=1 Tax=Trichodelitschia bisporula TaxID=703511 RepID=A0A6G1I980_9PEZI|nr:hypothetical protein EJ06DRAFT_535767 [Trichodelitschia bisporula]